MKPNSCVPSASRRATASSFRFWQPWNKRILEWLNDGTASNDPSTAQHFGNGFLMRQGYIMALSAYPGDVTPGPNVLSVDIPVAVNSDGSPVTGLVVAELAAGSASATTINLPYARNGRSSKDQTPYCPSIT
jgi:hypothetical protein